MPSSNQRGDGGLVPLAAVKKNRKELDSTV